MFLSIGYDLRITPAANAIEWSQSRRDQYLLRPSIPMPISIDRGAWKRIPGVDDNGPYGLMNELNAISYVRLNEGTAVRISVSPRDEEEERFWGSTFYGFAFERAASSQCLLLGYDVADRYLLSGLTNCGFDEDEIVLLRNHWGGLLNEWGLFREEDDARSFADLSDIRVREHNPFSVYRLEVGSP